MSDQNYIDKSTIGEVMLYSWDCPDCHHDNEFFEYEPVDGDTLHCDGCLSTFEVRDD